MGYRLPERQTEYLKAESERAKRPSPLLLRIVCRQLAAGAKSRSEILTPYSEPGHPRVLAALETLVADGQVRATTKKAFAGIEVTAFELV